MATKKSSSKRTSAAPKRRIKAPAVAPLSPAALDTAFPPSIEFPPALRVALASRATYQMEMLVVDLRKACKDGMKEAGSALAIVDRLETLVSMQFHALNEEIDLPPDQIIAQIERGETTEIAESYISGNLNWLEWLFAPAAGVPQRGANHG